MGAEQPLWRQVRKQVIAWLYRSYCNVAFPTRQRVGPTKNLGVHGCGRTSSPSPPPATHQIAGGFSFSTVTTPTAHSASVTSPRSTAFSLSASLPTQHMLSSLAMLPSSPLSHLPGAVKLIRRVDRMYGLPSTTYCSSTIALVRRR